MALFASHHEHTISLQNPARVHETSTAALGTSLAVQFDTPALLMIFSYNAGTSVPNTVSLWQMYMDRGVTSSDLLYRSTGATDFYVPFGNFPVPSGEALVVEATANGAVQEFSILAGRWVTS